MPRNKKEPVSDEMPEAQRASLRALTHGERPSVFENISGHPKVLPEDIKKLCKGITSPVKIALITALAQLGSVTRACQVVDISTVSVWNWKREDDNFRDAFNRAMEMAADLMDDELMRRACEGVLRPIFQGGKLVGSVRERSDTLLIFGLKGAKPEKYADRQKVEVTDVTERLRAARERALGRKK